MKKQVISILEGLAVPALFVVLLAIANHTGPLEVWLENFFFGGR
jgi:hypothetical protein